MKTFVHEGDRMAFTAPSDVTAGVPIIINNLIVIPAKSVASGEDFTGHIEGIFDLPALTTDVGDQGDRVYWDVGDGHVKLDSEGGANELIGVYAEPKTNGQTTVAVRLEGVTVG